MRFGFIVCAVIFLGITTFKISRPWELLHDDNGAFYTTIALSHLRLGFSKTLGHNFSYPNHPSGLGLILTPVVALFGPQNRAAIRFVPIVLHLLGLVWLLGYIYKAYGARLAVIGAYVLALIPMSSFFGRLVNFEPFLLPALILFILSYFQRNLFLVVIASLWGSLIDWPFYFGLLACLGHAVISYLATKEKRRLKVAIFLALLGLIWGVLALAHIGLAFGAEGLLKVLDRVHYATHPQESHSAIQIFGHILEYTRRYYTEVLFLGGILYFWIKAHAFYRERALALKDQVILVFFATGFLNIVLAPNYARIHHYWGFYLMPFMVLSFLEVLEWLKRKYPLNFGKIWVVAILLVTVSSAVTLRIRHTRINSYTIKTVQEYQRFMN